jgi:hypothetical protein
MDTIQSEFVGFCEEWDGEKASYSQLFAVVRVRHHDTFAVFHSLVSRELAFDKYAVEVIGDWLCRSVEKVVLDHEREFENRILYGTGSGTAIGFLPDLA